MTTLMQASQQWATRPDDQRFTSLDELVAHTRHQREISKGIALPSRKISCAPVADDESRKSLVVLGPNGPDDAAIPTHWAFSKISCGTP